jgi:hypothetical protein
MREGGEEEEGRGEQTIGLLKQTVAAAVSVRVHQRTSGRGRTRSC